MLKPLAIPCDIFLFSTFHIDHVSPTGLAQFIHFTEILHLLHDEVLRESWHWQHRLGRWGFATASMGPMGWGSDPSSLLAAVHAARKASARTAPPPQQTLGTHRISANPGQCVLGMGLECDNHDAAKASRAPKVQKPTSCW